MSGLILHYRNMQEITTTTINTIFTDFADATPDLNHIASSTRHARSATNQHRVCWKIGMHCSYLMLLLANKSESLLIAPLLDYLLGLQRMSVLALACVSQILPWKIRPRI
jgi:hypothetical protein